MEAPVSARPQPNTGLPPGVEVGPLGARFVAYLIDSAVPAVIGIVLSLILPQATGTTSTVLGILGAALTLGWVLLLLQMVATRAASPGLRVMKLQVVGFYDGRPIGWGRAIIRYLILSLLSGTGIVLIVMLILLVLHPRKQGWHDLAAKGVVIKERNLAPRSSGTTGQQSAQPSIPAQPGGYPPGYAAGQYGQGHDDQGQYGQGQYGQGQYGKGQYGQGQYGQGQYEQSQYEQGQYQPGQYEQGHYEQGQGEQPGHPPVPQAHQPAASAPGPAQPPGHPLEAAVPPPSYAGASVATGPIGPQSAPPQTAASPQSAPSAPPLDPPSADAEVDQDAEISDPAPTGPPEPEALAGWVARLDDGRDVEIDGLVLLGRNPQPQPGEEDAQLIKIADETRTVSKSHLAIGIDAAGLFVVDRGSTNGSTVTNPAGTSTRCQPGEVVYVSEGSIVSIGDHWLEITRG